MTFSIEFLEEAEKDLKKLDHSVQIQVLKGISKVSQNPLSAEEGGYGKPLGNKSGTNLTNLLLFPPGRTSRFTEKLQKEEISKTLRIEWIKCCQEKRVIGHGRMPIAGW